MTDIQITATELLDEMSVQFPLQLRVIVAELKVRKLEQLLTQDEDESDAST